LIASSGVTQTVYWDAVASCGGVPAGHAFLRAYSDLVAIELMDRFWGAGDELTAVKTDLYDENWSPAVVRRLSELSGLVIGMDISPQVAANAKPRIQRAMLSAADVRALPFAAGSVDRILSLSTIDHFREEADIHKALGEFRRVLRPGGELILTMDNPANPVVWLRNSLPFEFLHRAGLVPYFVGKTMRPRALCDAVAHTGMEVRECTAVMHFPRVAALALHRMARSPAAQARCLEWIRSFEALAHWPSRNLTGYFTAILAANPDP
jgi:SAM-dependent methyltransferase